MAVVVEPILTEEKLRSLLDEGHEQPCLDYKRRLDLSVRREIVELAKDVAAMQSEPASGYIVVDADDHGAAVADLTVNMAKLFDEATLRPKLSRHLADPSLSAAPSMGFDDNAVALLYVACSEHGWCINIRVCPWAGAPGRRKLDRSLQFISRSLLSLS